MKLEGHSQLQRNALSVLTDVLSRCAQHRLPVGLLRPKPLVAEETIYGDYDLFCAPGALHQLIQSFCMAARERGVSLHLVQAREAKSELRIWGPTDGDGLSVEVWTRIELTMRDLQGSSGPAFLNVEDFEPHICFSSQSASLESAPASLIYLTHLYHKNKDLAHSEVRRRLEWYRTQLTSDVKRTAGNRTDTHYAALKLLSSLSDPSELAEASYRALEQLQVLGIKPHVERLRGLRKKLWRRHQQRPRRARHPVVAVVGPDGTGKSTVLQAVADACQHITFGVMRFKKFFRKYRILSRYTKSRGRGVARNVQEERLSSWISLLALLRLTVLRVTGWTPGIWIIDRYFYDYYFLGLRDSAVHGHRKTFFARFIAGFVPRPAVLVVCHCPESMREERKPGELSAESAALLYDTYISQITEKKVTEMLFFSTAGPLDETQNAASYICTLIDKLGAKR